MLHDVHNPENQSTRTPDGKYISSVTFTRGKAATTAAVAVIKRPWDLSDAGKRHQAQRQVARMVRAQVRAMNLTPQQLFELGRTAGAERQYQNVIRPMELDDVMPGRDYSLREWRTAASYVETAAAMLIAESYVPEDFSDYWTFAEIVCGQRVSNLLAPRETKRLLKRLQENLRNLFYGFPVDYGMPSEAKRKRQQGEEVATKQKPTLTAPKKRKDKAPMQLVAARAATQPASITAH